MPIGVSIETVIALVVAAGSGGLAVGRRMTDRALGRGGVGRPPDASADGLPATDDAPETGAADSPARERILRDLRAHGGQLRQQQLVRAHTWSPATVSRHLSEMEAEGTVERYRHGREKVVCLPGIGPGTTESRDSSRSSPRRRQ